MSDPKTETSQPTTSASKAMLSAANGTAAPANDAELASANAETTETAETDGTSDTSKQTASKTSASKSNTKSLRRSGKSTAGKQASAKEKAGADSGSPGFGGPIDTSWFFSQWQDVVDRQLSTLRANMNNWPGKAMVNMDDSKTAMSDAADNLKECSQTLSEGMRHINHHVIDNMQTDVNRVLEVTRALLDAKTLEEAVEIQSGFVHETTHAQLQNTRELSEMAIQATKDSFEPFSETWQNFYANMTKQANK